MKVGVTIENQKSPCFTHNLSCNIDLIYGWSHRAKITSCRLQVSIIRLIFYYYDLHETEDTTQHSTFEIINILEPIKCTCLQIMLQTAFFVILPKLFNPFTIEPCWCSYKMHLPSNCSIVKMVSAINQWAWLDILSNLPFIETNTISLLESVEFQSFPMIKFYKIVE